MSVALSAMFSTMAKTKPAFELVPPSALATIEADIASLKQVDSKLHVADGELRREDIALRQSLAPASNDVLHHEALKLLDGDNAEKPAKSASVRLQEIATERARIAKAREIAEHRLKRLMFDRVLERKKLVADEWKEKTRELALTAAKLQRLNRERRQILSTLIDPNGHIIDMPAGFAERSAGLFLGGTGATNGGDFYEFLTLVVRLGIVTKGELEKA